MESRNPDYAARVRTIVEEAPFVRLLGLTLDDVTPGRCVTSLTVRDDLCQQDGYVHAGVQATMADHTAGSAAYSLAAADAVLLTAEFKINLLRPAVGDSLRCTADVLRPGRNLMAVEATVEAVRDGEARACARALVTLVAAGA